MSTMNMVRPLCFSTSGLVRTRDAVVGKVRAGGPDLLAVDDPVVAVAHRLGPRGRRRRSRRRVRRRAGTRSPRRAALWATIAILDLVVEPNAITVGTHMPRPIANGPVGASNLPSSWPKMTDLHRRAAPAALLLRPGDPGEPVLGLGLLPGLARQAGLRRPRAAGRRSSARSLRRSPGASLRNSASAGCR